MQRFLKASALFLVFAAAPALAQQAGPTGRLQNPPGSTVRLPDDRPIQPAGISGKTSDGRPAEPAAISSSTSDGRPLDPTAIKTGDKGRPPRVALRKSKPRGRRG